MKDVLHEQIAKQLKAIEASMRSARKHGRYVTLAGLAAQYSATVKMLIEAEPRTEIMRKAGA